MQESCALKNNVFWEIVCNIIIILHTISMNSYETWYFNSCRYACLASISTRVKVSCFIGSNDQTSFLDFPCPLPHCLLQCLLPVQANIQSMFLSPIPVSLGSHCHNLSGFFMYNTFHSIWQLMSVALSSLTDVQYHNSIKIWWSFCTAYMCILML